MPLESKVRWISDCLGEEVGSMEPPKSEGESESRANNDFAGPLPRRPFSFSCNQGCRSLGATLGAFRESDQRSPLWGRDFKARGPSPAVAFFQWRFSSLQCNS